MSGIIGTGGKSGVIGAGSREGWILLQNETASGASVTIDSTINSTYDEYMIVGSLVCFTDDSQLIFQAVLGGTLRTNNYKTQSHFLTSNATEINTTSASYAHAFIAGGANVQGASAYGGINFNMYLSRPHVTTSRHTIWGSVAYRSSGGLSQGGSFSAIRETDAGALTEIKFFSSAYNFESGTIKLYGLSK